MFTSKESFEARLCEYWAYKGTHELFEDLNESQTPKHKLFNLIRLIKRHRLEGEAWIRLRHIGRNNEQVKSILNEVETLRMIFLSNLIKSLGYSESEAKQKARTFMYYIFGRIMLEWSGGFYNEPNEDEIYEILEMTGIEVD